MDWLKFNANLNLNDSLKLIKFYATEPRWTVESRIVLSDKCSILLIGLVCRETDKVRICS